MQGVTGWPSPPAAGQSLDDDVGTVNTAARCPFAAGSSRWAAHDCIHLVLCGLCAHNSPLTCMLGFVLSAFVLTTTSQHHQLSGSELQECSLGFAFSCQSCLPFLPAVEQEDVRGFRARARCVSAIEMQRGTQHDLMLGGEPAGMVKMLGLMQQGGDTLFHKLAQRTETS